MIIVDKASKRVAWYVTVFKAIKAFTKSTFKPVPVKFPFKYFIITVISTIIIWTILASAVIYRNAYKDGIGELADVLHFKGRREKHRVGKAVKAFLFAPFNFVSANLFPEEIPHINIDIKFKHYQKLIQKRKEALSLGRLVTGPTSYIPAKIRHQNDTYEVKLRLKGDMPDHWMGDKWSFRIQMKGKNHLFGVRRFSLQDPMTRGFEGESIYFEALRREGVLTPRYFFVDLTVNGDYKGLMAFEEHFSKELLESQERKESVILKFVDSLSVGNYSSLTFDNYMNNLIKPFRFKRISKSKELSGELETATGLLRGFADGTLSSSQVFDIELMGRFLAVSSVWGAWHPIRWYNLRFYYNPITARLEPVAYDASLRYFKRKPVEPTHSPFAAALLESDLEIRPFYEDTLKKLQNEAEKGITEEWVRPIQERSLRILHKEYPLLGGINLFGMAEAASLSLRSNKDTLEHYERILTAYLIEDETGNYLELVNHLPQKILVSRIERVDQKTGKRLALNTTLPLEYPFSLPRTPIRTAPHTKKIFFQEPSDIQNSKFLVSAQAEGNEKIWTVEASNFFPVRERNPVPSKSLDQVLVDHPFLTQIPETDSLKIKQGEWLINSSFVIPKGMTLIIQKGTTLKFDFQSAFIAKGPILIEGTQDFPVVLEGLGSPDGKQSWQGIVVLNSQKPSIWSHVQIKNTSGISKDGWALTGGVNFYESDIEMDHVIFSGNRAEDALNIVRSKFELKNVTIKNTTSDAFDSDFSNGTVENGVFETIGSQGEGDGIDVSGSEVVVTRTRFKNISDKAISVGENSYLKANDVNIENVVIGAASKDGSRLFISDSKFTGIKKAGLMAYIKKLEYGPAEITAERLVFHSTEKRAIAQSGNKIIIDGIEISSEGLNVKEFYTSAVKP